MGLQECHHTKLVLEWLVKIKHMIQNINKVVSNSLFPRHIKPMGVPSTRSNRTCLLEQVASPQWIFSFKHEALDPDHWFREQLDLGSDGYCGCYRGLGQSLLAVEPNSDWRLH